MDKEDGSPDSYKNKRQILFNIIKDTYWHQYLQGQINEINSSGKKESKDINKIVNILSKLDSDYDYIQNKITENEKFDMREHKPIQYIDISTNENIQNIELEGYDRAYNKTEPYGETLKKKLNTIECNRIKIGFSQRIDIGAPKELHKKAGCKFIWYKNYKNVIYRISIEDIKEKIFNEAKEIMRKKNIQNLWVIDQSDYKSFVYDQKENKLRENITELCNIELRF